jgi:hypothetical protein
MPYHTKTRKKRGTSSLTKTRSRREEEPRDDDSDDGSTSSSSSSSSSSSDDDNEAPYKKSSYRNRRSSRSYSTSTCPNNLSFEDCELHILRAAVDEAEEVQGKKMTNSSDVQKIISIVENFLKKKNLVCYGGTAINNILPKKDQFYDKELEIPDYDFFSSTALEDAKELANIYYAAGFEEVEAKSGQHFGTYKVFVNFIPVADITSTPEELFKKLKQDAKRVNGIMYAPPNYLRMAMYLELSRPAGDVSRWEKVLKRLSILNKHYPIGGANCDAVEFQRKMQDGSNADIIYDTVKQTLIDQGCVFFGGFALSLYSKYLPRKITKGIEKNPDFDVLSEEPEMVAEILKERLTEMGIKRVKIQKLPGIGEIISPHYEIIVGADTVAMIYEPLACHSYNVIMQNSEEVYVATIDTMLSFYLAFLYVGDFAYNYDPERVYCMSHYLFEVQQKNRLNQKGVLKRFSLNCVGHQETIEEMRAKKSNKFVELKNKKNTKEYEEWFLRYRPVEIQKKGLKPAVEPVVESETTAAKKPVKKTRKKNAFDFNIFK